MLPTPSTSALYQKHLARLLECSLPHGISCQILDHFFCLPLDNATPLERWTGQDLPALSHQQTQLQLYSQAFPQPPSKGATTQSQLERLEATLKDDHEAIRSAVQLDISLEQRRNAQGVQEIESLVLQCLQHAKEQRIEAQSKLLWVDKSATWAICSFAGLLTASFVIYCTKVKYA
jgi:hypothetical protein